MIKSIGKTVEIRGNSNKIDHCLSCNSYLRLDDYNFSDGKCYICRSKGYRGKASQYIDIQGNNNVDEILKNKIGKR